MSWSTIRRTELFDSRNCFATMARDRSINASSPGTTDVMGQMDGSGMPTAPGLIPRSFMAA